MRARVLTGHLSGRAFALRLVHCRDLRRVTIGSRVLHRKRVPATALIVEAEQVYHHDVDAVRVDDVDDNGVDDDDDDRVPSWLTVGFLACEKSCVFVAARPGGGDERPEATMSLARTGNANPSSEKRCKT